VGSRGGDDFGLVGAADERHDRFVGPFRALKHSLRLERLQIEASKKDNHPLAKRRCAKEDPVAILPNNPLAVRSVRINVSPVLYRPEWIDPKGLVAAGPGDRTGPGRPNTSAIPVVVRDQRLPICSPSEPGKPLLDRNSSTGFSVKGRFPSH